MKKITTRALQLRQSCLLLALITSGILMTIGYSSPIISGSEVNENTSQQALTLWYQEPALEWEQALPLGNGRLGTMVYGGIQKEKLMLNEDSLWSGWPEPENDREGAHLALKKLRAAIKNGNIDSANKIALEEFCSLYGYGKPDFGAYQAFCDLEIDFNHDPKAVTNYRRELDLKTATATVSYTAKGIDYKREVFCSYPDQVTVMRITASKPASLDLKLSFTSLHHTSIGVENFAQKQPWKHGSEHLIFVLGAPKSDAYPIFISAMETSRKHLSEVSNTCFIFRVGQNFYGLP